VARRGPLLHADGRVVTLATLVFAESGNAAAALGLENSARSVIGVCAPGPV
jgi:hypothetical protein